MRKPEIMCIAGPNGSGKSTITNRLSIYDNSKEIYRIYKKKDDSITIWENEFWKKNQITKLTTVD